MKAARSKSSLGRNVVLVALAACAVGTIVRIGQLACSGAATASTPQSVVTGKPAAPAATAKSTDRGAELAKLYAACPMARVIDLATVASAPEKVDALLPPFVPTAHRVANPPLEPAVPRIRYPVAVGASEANSPQRDDTLRIADAPPAAKADAANSSQWLVDPKEWYLTPQESPAGSGSSVGGVSGADSAPKASNIPSNASNAPAKTDSVNGAAKTPSASETPPTTTQQAPAAAVAPPITPSAPAPTSPPAPTVPAPLFPPPAPAAGLPATSAPAPLPPNAASQPTGAPNADPHMELFAKNAYPSARDYAKCHEEIYNDWSISAHAYAAVSPMFNKFEQKLNDLSQGTVGYFCMRCHAPVATALCASRAEPLWNLPESAREGITCVACHRVQYVYGKSNGERRIEPGNIFAPVLGGINGDGVADAIHRKDQFKLKTSPDEQGPGQDIHNAGIFFEPLTRSEFCTPCHQVAVQPGIKLEVVWEQYRASPACKKGIQCQDCHMGRVPGLPMGYDCGPVAKIGDKTVNDNRKKSNHIFYGPNYPIAHPGVFPFNLKANRWTMEQWLTFDWRAGWGTKEFEKAVADGQIHAAFPPAWAEADDRFDAREIIDANFKKLGRKRDIRVEVMQNGSHVDGPYFDSPLCRGQDVRLHYIVTNTNEGHNLLTASLGAQPQLWANVVLIGPNGKRLWETGYTDSYGDVANIHSVDVRQTRAPYDYQLFNLQSMFLIEGAVGTDREFYVPVNFDFDQLPFIRPGVQPITTINHPPTIRMESQSLAPLGSRQVPYRIPGKLIQQPGTYRLSFRMRSRSEPPYFMRFCDATEEMLRAENEWMIDVHPMTVEFVVR